MALSIAVIAFSVLAAAVAVPAEAAQRHRHGASISHASAAWRQYTRAQFLKRVEGRNVFSYIAWRAQHRRPGETLAIAAGVDHVALYDGRVPETYRLLKLAKALGYHAFFLSGSGPRRGQERLARAGYAALFEAYHHCGGSYEAAARCKAAARRSIVQAGHTLVVNVGSNGAVWKYGPQAERTIKLRY